MKKGKLIIIIGPTASGKTELVRELLKIIPNSSRLITTTTRSRRADEMDGKDFYFLSEDIFKEKILKGDFLEYTETHGFHYGSSKQTLEEALNTHGYVFAVIDVKGADIMKAYLPDSLTIFIHPGSLEILRERLRKTRKGIQPDEIENRIRTAEFELSRSENFDMLIYNKEGRFEDTVKAVVDAIGKVV
jgi:guanylate kinase